MIRNGNRHLIPRGSAALDKPDTRLAGLAGLSVSFAMRLLAEEGTTEIDEYVAADVSTSHESVAQPVEAGLFFGHERPVSQW